MGNFNAKIDTVQKQKTGKFTTKQLEIVEQYKWDFKVRNFKMCMCVETFMYITICFFK